MPLRHSSRTESALRQHGRLGRYARAKPPTNIHCAQQHGARGAAQELTRENRDTPTARPLSSQRILAQGAINYLRYQRARRLLGEAMTEPAIDKRHLKALDAIMCDVGYHVHVFNVKLAVGLAFGINLALQPTLSFEDVRGLF